MKIIAMNWILYFAYKLMNIEYFTLIFYEVSAPLLCCLSKWFACNYYLKKLKYIKWKYNMSHSRQWFDISCQLQFKKWNTILIVSSYERLIFKL